MQNYVKRSIDELRCWLFARQPVPVNLILDRTAIDFLLAINDNNRRLNPDNVQLTINSIKKIGWVCSETLCVTCEGRLGNGQHRLTALKQLGYPEGIRATVVFGVDSGSLLGIDQHSKRSTMASIKIEVGKSYRANFLSAIRLDIQYNPNSMSFGRMRVHPSEISEKIDDWEKYCLDMPFLVHQQTIGLKHISLTAPMILAVVHYRQRAGVNKANDFLKGFWGEKDVAPDSPEQKAMNYRLTMNSFHQRPGSIYRVFAWLLLAHYEKRGNPKIREAASWGILNNIRTQ